MSNDFQILSQNNSLQPRVGEFRINALELVRQVFGYEGLVPRLNARGPKREDFKDDIPLIEISDRYPSSLLGTPIIDSVMFRAKDGTEFFLDDAPIIDLHLPKNIVTRQIRRHKGEVIEYINNGSYQVRIRGFICNHDSLDPPYERLQEFRTLIERLESLEVDCDLLRAFGIYNLAIRKPDFTTIPGMPNVQQFTLMCMSDEPVELLIS